MFSADQSAGKKMRRYINASVPVIEYIDELFISRNIKLNWWIPSYLVQKYQILHRCTVQGRSIHLAESCCCKKYLRLCRNIFHRAATILLLLCFKLFSITYVWPCWLPSIWKSTAGAVTHAMVFMKKMENSGDLYIKQSFLNNDTQSFLYVHSSITLSTGNGSDNEVDWVEIHFIF